MGRPTITRKYPVHFLDILNELKATPSEPVECVFYDRQKAKNFQLDFLSFKTAAVNEGWDRAGEFPAMYPELNAYKTRTRQDGERWIVAVYHMDFTEEAISISKQMEERRNRREGANSQNQLGDGAGVD